MARLNYNGKTVMFGGKTLVKTPAPKVNLLTDFYNTFGFTTFITSGTNITSAKVVGDGGLCTSNGIMCEIGDTIEFIFDLTKNSVGTMYAYIITDSAGIFDPIATYSEPGTYSVSLVADVAGNCSVGFSNFNGAPPFTDIDFSALNCKLYIS